MSLQFLSSLVLLVSTPLIAISHEKTTPVISEVHAFDTQSSISRFSHANEDVLKMSHIFLKELQRCRTENALEEKDVDRILSAVVFAAQKHQFQTRKDPKETPYIIHPIGVAHHLLTIGKVMDADVLIGALLHDTVEDTQTTFEEIEAAFGKRVGGFVKEVTDDKMLPKMERKHLQIMHAPEKSTGAALIKLADKLYNLNDLLKDPPLDWTEERLKEYFEWATQVVNALPTVNSALKQAVDETIAAYWKR